MAGGAVGRLGAAMAVLALAVTAPASATGGSAPSGTRWSVRGGDAWNWRETVRGTSDCDHVWITLNGNATPIVPRRGGGRFRATVRLQPGHNELVAHCGDQDFSEILEFEERLRPNPKARIRVSVAGKTVTLDGTPSVPGTFDHASIENYGWKARPGNPGPIRLGTRTGPTTSIEAPSRPGEYYVTLTVRDAKGRADRSTAYFVVHGGSPHRPKLAYAPAWVNRAVVYGVIPQLFGNDGFRSVAGRFGYLQGLGVNAIWLSPVFRSPPGDFGYAVNDFFNLNPDLGTKADFRTMVRQAHAHGIRVLMDFTANHTSATHPYFRDTKRYGRASHYWDFYDRKPGGERTHYFDWMNLPNLNYGDSETRHMIMAATSYWVRDFDIDGYRMDAAWGVHRRAPEFWRHWRRGLKRIKPDLLLLAEATARDPYYFSHGFDAAYDWSGLGKWAWGPAFTNSSSLYGYSLKPALTNSDHGYPKGGLVFRFLNNNDTGARFIAQQGPELTRVAAVLEFTVPGIPLIYAGDETGALYFPYEGLSPLDFGKDPFHLRPFYKRLVRLRSRWDALRSPDWRVLDVSPETEMVAYTRRGRGMDPLLVVLNFGPKASAEIPRKQLPGALSDASGVSEVFGKGTPWAQDPTTLHLRMEAESAVVLAPKTKGGAA